METSDEAPTLSGAALDALQEFYRDRDAREKQFEDLRAALDDEEHAQELSMDAFEEDWNESQFWEYSKETASILANQLLAGSTRDTTIAVISAPSAFIQLKNVLAKSGRPKSEWPKVYLLEYDERFGVFPEFIHYDFHNPLKLPANLKGTVDVLIVDPPFLSEDCQTKAAMTVRWLAKPVGSNQNPTVPVQVENTNLPTPRLVVCTGERMQTLICRLYRAYGIQSTTFLPSHAKGLSNEFYCYANFECSDWAWTP